MALRFSNSQSEDQMLYPYIKEQYESLHREKQGLKDGTPRCLLATRCQMYYPTRYVN